MAKRGRKPRYTEEESVAIATWKDELVTDEWLARVREEYGEASDATIRKYAKKGAEILRKRSVNVPHVTESSVVATDEVDEEEDDDAVEVDLAPPMPGADEEQEVKVAIGLTGYEKRCAAVAYAIQSQGHSITEACEAFNVNSDFRTLDMQATGNALLSSPRGAEALEEAKLLYDDVMGADNETDEYGDAIESATEYDPGDEPF